MPTYVWKAIDRQGVQRKGEIEGENQAIARQMLLRQNLRIQNLKPKPKDLLEYLPFLRARIKEKDLVIFTRQFSTMIDAGVPIVQCLDILLQQESNRSFKLVIKQVKGAVEAGSHLLRGAEASSEGL